MPAWVGEGLFQVADSYILLPLEWKKVRELTQAFSIRALITFVRVPPL